MSPSAEVQVVQLPAGAVAEGGEGAVVAAGVWGGEAGDMVTCERLSPAPHVGAIHVCLLPD